jgi:endonuclease YncB( thermonuclease family)
MLEMTARFSIAIWFSSVLVLTLSAQNAATELHFLHEDECGSPLYESQVWRGVRGKVIDVRSGASITIRTYADANCDGEGCLKAGAIKRVLLPAVDTSRTDSEARQYLMRTVLNLDVEVLSNPSRVDDGTLSGEVHCHGSDLSMVLLNAGLAAYSAKTRPYTISSYKNCLYRIAEREARTKHLGLWAVK